MIHRDDLVGLFCLGLDDATIRGPVNGVSPNPVTNREFARALGRALGRPAMLRAPRWALRAALGESADTVLASQRVIPQVAIDQEFSFQYDQLDVALTHLLTST